MTRRFAWLLTVVSASMFLSACGAQTISHSSTATQTSGKGGSQTAHRPVLSNPAPRQVISEFVGALLNGRGDVMSRLLWPIDPKIAAQLNNGSSFTAQQFANYAASLMAAYDQQISNSGTRLPLTPLWSYHITRCHHLVTPSGKPYPLTEDAECTVAFSAYYASNVAVLPVPDLSLSAAHGKIVLFPKTLSWLQLFNVTGISPNEEPNKPVAYRIPL